MIREAIEANGDNPESVSIKAGEHRPGGRIKGNTSCSANTDKPYVEIHKEGGGIEWPGSQAMLLVEKRKNDYIFVLEIVNFKLPDAVIHTLKERNLKSVIDIPGAEHFKIAKVTQNSLTSGPSSIGIRIYIEQI